MTTMTQCVQCRAQLDPDGSCFICETLPPGLCPRCQFEPCRCPAFTPPREQDDTKAVPAPPTQQEKEESAPTRHLTLTPASAFRPARVKWGWAGRMPIGELTLIPGREGIGKSLFLAWLAAQITRGTLPGEFVGTPRAVLYAASEDSWRYTIAPRLIAAGADLNLVYRINVETAGTGGSRLSLPLDCRSIPPLSRDVNGAALMLDPVVSHVDEKLSVNQSRELRQALEPLRDAAERAEIFVAALAHFNKATDTDVLSKIPGGRAWAEVARAAFALAADTDNGTFVASQIKNNLGRVDQAHLTYAIDEVFIDTDDGQTSVGRFRWTGETDVGVDEVLSRRPERQGRDVSDRTAEVVAYVESVGYPMPIAVIADKFPEIKRESLRKLLRRAAGRGELGNPLHGHYGPDRTANE
ncbi:AAA family ATPase [Actinoplanes sp. NPDC026623]|uniref:AAA family ATPase n=1 Tax=Actinoplanes sp. NPDC026623 TaxID=3155610 RepID=UPI0033E4E618